MDSQTLAALCVVLVFTIAVYVYNSRGFAAPRRRRRGGGGGGGGSGGGGSGGGGGGSGGGKHVAPERHEVGCGAGGACGTTGGGCPTAEGYPYSYAVPSAAFASGDSIAVDPLITGQLYAGARNGRRPVYGARTAPGSTWGMHEYSAGVPGEVGVDVGPLGLPEYSAEPGRGVYDDGIPPEWRLPSTPVGWYVPDRRDHYDVGARQAAVYATDLMPLQEPDHEPDVGPDVGPPCGLPPTT